MKRMLVAVLAVCCLLALAACAEKKTDEKNQIPNPIHECTAQELTEKAGVTLYVPTTAVDVTYSYIEGDAPLGQVSFTYQGKAYTCRGQKTGVVQDISGMCYEWTRTTNDSADVPYTCYLTDEGQGIAVWYAAGASYTISMAEGATEELLGEMYGIVTGSGD